LILKTFGPNRPGSANRCPVQATAKARAPKGNALANTFHQKGNALANQPANFLTQCSKILRPSPVPRPQPVPQCVTNYQSISCINPANRKSWPPAYSDHRLRFLTTKLIGHHDAQDVAIFIKYLLMHKIHLDQP